MVPIGQAGAEMKQNDIKYGEKAGAAFVQRSLLFLIKQNSKQQEAEIKNRKQK